MIAFVRTDLHTDIGHTDVGSREDLVFTVDVAALLDAGQSISSPHAYLTDRATGNDVTVACVGAVSSTGTKISAEVRALTSGKQYRLSFTFSPTAGIVRQTIWDLDCVK